VVLTIYYYNIDFGIANTFKWYIDIFVANIFMPQPDETGRHRHQCVRWFICYQNCEHNILKTNEPILMPSGRSGPQAKGMKRSTLGGQEVT